MPIESRSFGHQEVSEVDTVGKRGRVREGRRNREAAKGSTGDGEEGKRGHVIRAPALFYSSKTLRAAHTRQCVGKLVLVRSWISSVSYSSQSR